MIIKKTDTQDFAGVLVFRKNESTDSGYWPDYQTTENDKENFDRNCAFFSARAHPSKLVYIGAKDGFRNFLRLVSQTWMS